MIAITRCGYVLPRREGIVCGDGDLPQCLLMDGHVGEHLILNDYGRYVLWTWDDACDASCEFCDECFVWNEISEKEALELIQKSNE